MTIMKRAKRDDGNFIQHGDIGDMIFEVFQAWD